MLGIGLMLRIRGSSDVVSYRPDKALRYRHIDVLFDGEIDRHLRRSRFVKGVRIALDIMQTA